MRKRKRQSKGPYVAVPKAIMVTPAWRTMSPWARLLWIDLRAWLRNDDLNNGKVHRSCRAAAQTLGFDKKTTARGFAELDHYGFVRKTVGGFLGSDGRGIATKYRFTDLAHGTHPPTRDFEKWDGEVYVEPSHRPAPKKQNPVPPHGTPCTAPRDIRRGAGGRFVCTAPRDIDGTGECPAPRDTSRLPLPPVGEAALRGSSTVRAPAQAGGAGSSPAPVASLTEYVLSIVSAELDRLNERKAT